MRFFPIVIMIILLIVIITAVSFILKYFKLAKERNEILKDNAKKDDLDK
ncbi:hypothetical protein [Heyndrickxia acidicola]|uniref:Uncharacterized protein n=1 Tax=Heyndrickxia acidicola TaxID=209389 RepID=A0ABU6MBN0_9BACI|nr:hypothetical protein [Heyndrickxia acidicola]MED1201828.1 hypothetical protein [Heyndrickxia acidicola]